MRLSFRKFLFYIFLPCLTIFLFQTYLPSSFIPSRAIVYTIKPGMSYQHIARDLKDKKIIRSTLFFELYVLASQTYSKLQAGKYYVSSNLTVAQIVDQFKRGDVAREQLLIVPGWTLKNIAQYLENHTFASQEDFFSVASQEYKDEFNFLGSKPKKLNLEGYLFPDTYYVTERDTVKDLIIAMLTNFDKKLTPDVRIAIAAQHKSIFQIITMASILEKEVRTLQDKKIVSGILWKRLSNGMPLQVDATLNYASDSRSSFSTKVAQDSPYNTYKYTGLPLGPISNPGMDSILAAVYPKKSNYWYYLSARKTGKTIFSTTFLEHQSASVQYLK